MKQPCWHYTAWPAPHLTVGTALLQDDDIPGIVRFRTYEVLKEEVANPKLRWAYLPYSMHMAGPREAIQHMIIRRNYGQWLSNATLLLWFVMCLLGWCPLALQDVVTSLCVCQHVHIYMTS